MGKSIADIGNEITWMDKKTNQQLSGKVSKVLENSVIVDLTIMDNSSAYVFDFDKTVVSHKRYKIIK